MNEDATQTVGGCGPKNISNEGWKDTGSGSPILISCSKCTLYFWCGKKIDLK